MTDTSTEAVEAIARHTQSACKCEFDEMNVAETLRALAAERDALRAALAEIERQFGSTPGGHMAATIARTALNAERKNHG